MPTPATPPPPSQKDLLDELNSGGGGRGGADAMPPMAPGDAPPVPAPGRDAELTVPPAAPGSAASVADAVHATRSGGTGYRVKVAGEYFAVTADGQKGKIKKPYEAEFLLPNLDAPLSVIKNKLLTPYLRKKHEDFTAVRTQAIVDVRPLNPATPMPRNLQYMARRQLEEHVKANRIPIDPSVECYPNVLHLREAIIDYTQTPRGFEAREAARQDRRQADAELRGMNPDVEIENGR